MLERLEVDNYKCLVGFELDLDELTLLLGVNGAGKSSVLDVVLATRQLLSGGCRVTDATVFPSSTLTRWGVGNWQSVEMHARLGGETFNYRLEVEHEVATKRARIMRERLTVEQRALFEFIDGDVRLYRDDHTSGPEFSSDWSESALARVVPAPDNTRLTRFLEFVRGIVVCRLHPPAFRTEVDGEAGVLSVDGANFGAWYRSVLQEHPHLGADFNRALGEVIDGLYALRLVPVGIDTRALAVTFKDGDRSFDLYFGELSDGQRALVALYGLLHLVQGPATAVFLDEPDNYVALAEIQPWAAALASACGETMGQAVLCSHHPELIDYFGGESGRLMWRDAYGAVAVGAPQHQLTGPLKLSEAIARGWEE